MPRIAYNPSNWYWLGQPIGQSSPIVYSSSVGALISTSNAGYVAWLALGNGATPWPKDETGAITTAALDDVLTSVGLPPTGLTAPTKTQLQVYANSKLTTLFTVARTYSLGSVSVKCDTTTTTGANLAALNAWGTANPAATTQWVDNFGAVTQITGAQAVTLASDVIVYGQSVYAILASAMTGIAGNTITTTAQIDALSWPT